MTWELLLGLFLAALPLLGFGVPLVVVALVLVVLGQHEPVVKYIRRSNLSFSFGLGVAIVYVAGCVVPFLLGSIPTFGSFRAMVFAPSAYLAGLVVAGYALTYLPEYRAVNGWRSPIDHLSPGSNATVVGEVDADETVGSPTTGTPVVAYRFRTDLLMRDPRRGPYWSTESIETAAVPFYVEDGTGRIRVEPNDEPPVLDPDSEEVDGGAGSGELEARGVGSMLGGTDEGEGSRRRLEARLEPGDDVLVAGQVSGNGDAIEVDAGSGGPFAAPSFYGDPGAVRTGRSARWLLVGVPFGGLVALVGAVVLWMSAGVF